MSKQINVIGLGAGDIEQLPLGLYRELVKTNNLYLRTEKHPVIQSLKKEDISYQSFDYIYEQRDQFEDVYEQIVLQLLKELEHKSESIVYAVPGHPMLAEKTVQLLLKEERERNDLSVRVIGGQSYLDDLFTTLQIDPIEGFQFLDATSFNRGNVQYQSHVIFCQVYDQHVASEVKLTLMEDLPDDYEVFVVHAAGSEEEWVKKLPLYELDREVSLNNLISVYVPPADVNALHHQFDVLRNVVARLRGPNGCPWDRQQTHESLRQYLIEEAYEVVEAIDDEDDEALIEELGDVLLQVMLHGQIGEDVGYFSVDDIIRSVTEKMIRRHPHVFQDQSNVTTDEVMANWEKIKQQEKGGEKSRSFLEGIPRSFPALLYAYELQKKAGKVGFDWDEADPMFEKITEEIEEFKDAVTNKDTHDAEIELGDIFFALVNVARYYKINPEIALQQTNRKFERRFSYMENEIQKEGLEFQKLSLIELNRYWEKAKEFLRKSDG
ncbi:nucleoside triphosphate pyrophosphohydrolase [Salirhabdus salicampi]|uniref:nucleoside triphosphate pyrophosphohydrolase n=1 Tax=Salirhabdus salicampi TaxID=476102 RepID=UPI0020C33D00|nr:nucleoside triphosphate pyrophosphohydrolase [Salirhabdus salicampi]MCP8618179.1 nucleoside triphosphate pyrophosphohydrolase [Salirhabdus salicampi]